LRAYTMGKRTLNFPPGTSSASVRKAIEATKRKDISKKAPGKKAPAKKAPAKKAPSKKASAKKAPARKAPARKAPARKAPARKAPDKKAVTKEAVPVKTPAKKAPAKKKADTPCTRYFDRLEKIAGNDGYIMIRGVNDPDADSDEEHEERSNDSYTEQDMSRMRVVIGSAQRKRYQSWIRTLLLGDQANDRCFLMFDTSFSYTVEEVLEQMVGSLEKQKDMAKRFDMLLALTLNLDEYDVWMHDHEVEFLDTAPRLLARLAKLWKGTLSKSDDALGIDKEFTRQGAHAVLEKFQRDVENIDTCGFAPPLQFKWE